MEEETPLPASRVLIVDDNQQNLELLAACVEGIPNVTITLATNGREALSQVAQAVPDLILLDVMMPKMSGFEVCRQIKGDPHTRDIQIIMVTALNELGDHERARDCGTDDFLTKPVNRNELVARVKSLLRVRHMKRDQSEEAPGAHEAGPH